jgi:hypothetical protein
MKYRVIASIVVIVLLIIAAIILKPANPAPTTNEYGEPVQTQEFQQ